jgi:hypothetical protein
MRLRHGFCDGWSCGGTTITDDRNSRHASPGEGVTHVLYFVYEDEGLYREEQQSDVELFGPRNRDSAARRLYHHLVGDTPVVVLHTAEGASLPSSTAAPTRAL